MASSGKTNPRDDGLDAIRTEFSSIATTVVAHLDLALIGWAEDRDVSADLAERDAVHDARCHELEEHVLATNIRLSGQLFGERRRFLDAVLIEGIALERVGNLAVEIAGHVGSARARPGETIATNPDVRGVASEAVSAFQGACAAFVTRDPALADHADRGAADVVAGARAAQAALMQTSVITPERWRAYMLLAARCVERVAANAASLAMRTRWVLGTHGREETGRDGGG